MPKKLFRYSGIAWLLCIVLFFVVLIVNYFLVFYFKINNGFIAPILLGIFGLGVIAFLFIILSFILIFFEKIEEKTEVSKKHPKTFKGKLLLFPKFFLVFLIFPIFCLVKVIKPLKLINKIKNEGFISFKKTLKFRAILGNTITLLFIVIIIFPIWIGGYFLAFSLLGFTPFSVPVIGSSMLPTVSDKGQIPAHSYHAISKLLYKPTRGDLVVFKSAKTQVEGKAVDYLKRIIAVPGDRISIRDGSVVLNGQVLKESYTLKPRSTFGRDYLRECKELLIPEGNFFVLGDNRQRSKDSRDIGLVSINEIGWILPYKEQERFKNLWRDPSSDLADSSKIKVNKPQYLELLNQKRKEKGVQLLKYEPRLELSASKRGSVILKYNDFSYEATTSGYTQVTAMNDAGYSNIVWNEAFTQGYYETDELIKYYFDFPEWSDFMLNKDMQEMGIAEVEGEINGCPTQVMVQHFAGYIPPNYKNEDIESWGKLINNLNDVIPSWEKAKGWKNINQDDLNKLIDLMYRRRNNAEAIYYRMKANQWLTTEEKNMQNADKSLYEGIESLAKKLNSSH